jgi:hypothetical protein
MTSPPVRVETVRVRHAGRGPVAVAALVVTLVAVSIVKPWAGPGPAQLDAESASPMTATPGPRPASPAAALDASAAPSGAPGSTESALGAEAFLVARADVLTPGQIQCGSAEWRIVTLGGFARWTVRTSIAIEPVEADGPGDASIPDLALGDSDVAGLGACAPRSGAGAPGRASRIVAAWRISSGQDAAATFGPVPLADLDPLPSGGPIGARPGASRAVAELVRPIITERSGRWPAGRYVLLLASPDAGPDRWIGIDIGPAGS